MEKVLKIIVDYRCDDFGGWYEIDYKKYIPTGVYKEIGSMIYIEIFKKSCIPFMSYKFFVCEEYIHFIEEIYYKCEG